jgi:CheY-like chemotaxis protein
MLGPEGHAVVEAADGQQALFLARNQRFDVVLLDNLMEGRSGFEVLEELRAIGGDHPIPVVMVTGVHDPVQVMREMRAGAVDHIAKPFDATVLLGAIERALTGLTFELDDRRRALAYQAEVYADVDNLRAGLPPAANG